MICICFTIRLFFFNDTATTEIYTLSLHDALPICARCPLCSRSRDHLHSCRWVWIFCKSGRSQGLGSGGADRKSTRLNSSHQIISYAVFCLKKKKIDGRSPLMVVEDRHRNSRDAIH